MEKKLHMEGLVYQNTSDSSRINKARAVKSNKDFQPTWHQVWVTGYDLPTGSHKKGIYQMKMSDLDKKRLQEVQQAVADGELSAGVTDLKKFNKSHALRLYSKLVEQRKDQYITETLKKVPSNYHSINTHPDFIKLVGMLRESTVVALDTETTGLHYEKDTVVGMSLTLPEFDYNCYIPFLHENSNVGEQLDKGMVMEYLNTYINIHGMTVIMFNAKFDMHMLYKDDLFFDNCRVYDALVGMKLLNENEPSYQLKKLVNRWGKYFGVKDDSLTFEELFSKDPVDFYKNADYRLCWYYACKDTDLTWKLWTFIEEQLAKHEGLAHSFYDREVPCTKVFFNIECNGLPIDLDYAAEYAEQLRTEIAELDSKINDFFGELNWDSPVQVKKLLYTDMKLKSWDGKDSTNKQSLKNLSKEVPELNWVLERRQKVKLLSSFIEPIPELVWSDGRIHGTFDANGAKTGRTASKSPNMQNLSKAAKKMFRAPKGWLLVDLDYSQCEPRTLAHMSGDHGLQSPYINGGDLYVETATRIYGEKYNMTPDQFLESDDTTWRTKGFPQHPRQISKRALLSTMYSTSAFGLSTMAGISVEAGQEYIDAFHTNYPVASQYMKDCVAFVDKHGYCLTMGGRKRRFPGHVHTAAAYHRLMEQAERLVGHKITNVWQEKQLPRSLKMKLGPVAKDYNTVVRQIVNERTQGSAAEIMKDALIAVDKKFRTDGTGNQIVGTVHDSMVLLVHDDTTADYFNSLKQTMVGAAHLYIPMKADVAVSLRYGNDVPVEEWLEKGYDCFDERGFAV